MPPSTGDSPDAVDRILTEIFQHMQDSTPVSLNAKMSHEDSPLHVAVVWQDEEYVRVLLAAGADPNAQGDLGCTPLHTAVRRDNKNIVSLLLAHGARIDILNEMDSTPLDCCRQDAMRGILVSWEARDRLP